MPFHARMTLAELLEEFPEAEEILSDYGVEVGREAPQITIADLCDDHDIDIRSLRDDLHWNSDR